MYSNFVCFFAFFPHQLPFAVFFWLCRIFSLNKKFSKHLFSLNAGCRVPVLMLSSLPLFQYVAGQFPVPSLLLLR